MKRRHFLTSLFAAQVVDQGEGRGGGAAAEHLHFDFNSDEYLDYFYPEKTNNQYLTSTYSDIGKAMRVDIPKGNHYGTRMVFNTEDQWNTKCEEFQARYRIYIPDDIDIINQLKLPLIGNRDTQGWGGRKSDGTGGWSSRVALHDRRRTGLGVEFYTYHADMEGQYGDHDEWGCEIPTGQWSTIDFYVKTNTPGENNGEIWGLLNDTYLSSRRGLKFREEGYDEFSINEFEFLIYHGGSSHSPKDNYVVVDNTYIWKGENKIV